MADLPGSIHNDLILPIKSSFNSGKSLNKRRKIFLSLGSIYDTVASTTFLLHISYIGVVITSLSGLYLH